MIAPMHLRSPYLLLLLLTACPSDDDPATDPTDPTAATDPTAPTEGTDDTDTSGPVVGCECILDEEPTDPNSGPSGPTCGDSPCPNVVGACIDSYCELGGVFELADPTALECALVALRDRTPGIVVWSFDEGSGVHTDDGYLLVNADGTAVSRHWDREDLNFEVSDAVLGQLPPAAVFDACRAEPSDLTRFDCLRAALEQPAGTCDEGWSCVECI